MKTHVLAVTFIILNLAIATAQSSLRQSCLPRIEYQPLIVSNPETRVTFHCDRGTRMDLIKAVGYQTRIPLGVVLGTDRKTLLEETHSYQLDRVDARTALREALAGTGYSLQEDDGVIVMVAGDLTARQSSLLDHAFSDFKPGERQSMVDLGFDLTMWVGAVVDPKRGYAASYPGSTNDERFTLRVDSGATTKQIANEIVRQGSKGLWIFKTGASSSSASGDELDVEPYQHYSNAP